MNANHLVTSSGLSTDGTRYATVTSSIADIAEAAEFVETLESIDVQERADATGHAVVADTTTQPSNDLSLDRNPGSVIIIERQKDVNLTLEPQIAHRVIIKNCQNVHVNLRHVRFAAAPNDIYVPIVEIQGGKNNTASHIKHHVNYSGWTAREWEQARRGVLISGGKNNRVEDVSLQGVRFGVELYTKGASAARINIQGYSYDAIRLLASKTSLDGATIADAYLANPRNHCDAIQMFPKVAPQDMINHELVGISIKNVDIDNNSTLPNQTWTQGVFLTDGRIRKSHFENIFVHSDQEHGFSLAEAHDCVLKNVVCTSSRPEVTSHISLSTNKPGYQPPTGIRLENCKADLVLVA